MVHTKETLDEALILLNDTLFEFRSGDMTKFDTGALSENIEILFADGYQGKEFIIDIYLRSDEFHENQIVSLISEDYQDFIVL